MVGFLTENGPFTWMDGTPSEYSEMILTESSNDRDVDISSQSQCRILMTGEILLT